jgi:hypothetical protein
MTADAHQMSTHHITTDDLAFSAYLKMKGHRLIKCDHKKSKTIFIFGANGGDLDPRSAEEIKVEFVNGPFLKYYNELRNLKKVI